MPFRAGLEGHDCAADARGSAALEGHVDPHRTCEILRRTLGRYARDGSGRLHAMPILGRCLAANRKRKNGRVGLASSRFSLGQLVRDCS